MEEDLGGNFLDCLQRKLNLKCVANEDNRDKCINNAYLSR